MMKTKIELKDSRKTASQGSAATKADMRTIRVTSGLRAGSQPQEMGFKQTRMDLGETGA